MSSYGTISVDRRAAYYERAAKVIAADMLDFYTRAERGCRIQRAIKRGDYVTPKAKPANVTPITKARRHA